MSREQLERYCELIAALKLRTSNMKGRHLSTSEAIRLVKLYGVETPEGHMQAPASLLTKPTVNRYLKRWGYDHTTLLKQPPAVRFQAEHSNECWHFDLAPRSQTRQGAGVDAGWPARPPLMLYSVVDDRSGLAYQEYHGVYGEDVEAALRFLFAAMAPKDPETFPFQGIPHMLYMDNGPIARSHVFQQVMEYLGMDVRTHMPRGSDGRRVTARAKGKVERPFRTVKEMHETLYHFHEPRPKRKPMRGSGSSSCGITACNIGPSRIRASRIGSSICRPPGCGPCAVGSASVRLPANRNNGRSASMPASRRRSPVSGGARPRR